ncbi:MAG: ribosome biogenesis GTP-binding protein YihA/YsxC [Defluviitaleaceae bacterium]|nr:ribosome biogenesis GTP-binding protein YihA/YsxC [Defluviitaleaceae bacterium]MCL2275633.1 ribosome biogenesis GTP-binding protein YihA/YsxC [Defluviitaleaceae bacterium]
MSLIINNTDIAATAVAPAQFPTTGYPEVAFVGRSNVGKSSLINAMLGRKKLARTSRQPGKTRTINFFSVEEKLYFVDLPGYGYAKVSKVEQEKWGGMVEGYLRDRAPLKRIFLLMDIRHEPSAGDRMIYEWCVHYTLPFTVIATKADKITRNQMPRHLSIMKKALGSDAPPIPFSAETRQGRDELWALILDSCGLGVL